MTDHRVGVNGVVQIDPNVVLGIERDEGVVTGLSVLLWPGLVAHRTPGGQRRRWWLGWHHHRRRHPGRHRRKARARPTSSRRP